ncbi:hypothetical protein ARMGADRAFT_1039531 [Armillaria gallica]|uniref:Uncharacterized protein n=1 Tax=Armillaria gallica TaxID=47427 RepID=A0A2H3CDK0_ARMGA|nr:hypothetical protein ARMGADRAFT_1039531 [Armillaria gallica]
MASDQRKEEVSLLSGIDATRVPHVTFEENLLLINELKHDTLNRSGGHRVLHATGNTVLLGEAKWQVIKVWATSLPELIVMGLSSVPWPSSRHHAPRHTVWFNSESPEDLAIPGPINPIPDVGTVNRTWTVVSSLHCHVVHLDPQYHDEYFQLSKNMKLSWVTDATKVWYKKEKEKKAIQLQLT